MNNGSQFHLNGKTAIVTGAASGIGLAIAETFAAAGATVRVVDLNADNAASAAKKISEAGGAATAHACDLSDEAATNRVVSEIVALGPITTLVNNVGVAHIGTIESTSSADFDRLLNVNVKGYFFATRAAIPHMKEAGGVILNMASISGMLGLADRFAYSTTKGAVIAMTYSIARDYLKHQIRCNCISPARVHTPFVDGYLKNTYPGREQEMFETLSKVQPIGRMGEPPEIAALALYLCSDASGFLTGCNYPIDGGFVNLRG
jgi:2-keto-3-deoxy-L-fuconate dehydrogenase